MSRRLCRLSGRFRRKGSAHAEAPGVARHEKGLARRNHPRPSPLRRFLLRHERQGTELAFWEFNLRFKTDTSPSGPAPGKPVLVGQGMQGDRAEAVFASPREIAQFIREQREG